jgi:hypothetical protein
MPVFAKVISPAVNVIKSLPKENQSESTSRMFPVNKAALFSVNYSGMNGSPDWRDTKWLSSLLDLRHSSSPRRYGGCVSIASP